MGLRQFTLESLVMLNPSFWRDRRVFITGHTGFKGSWLLLWLLQLGSRVNGYSLPADPEPNLFRSLWPAPLGEFIHFEDELADRSALQRAIESAQPEVVLHLAAQPLVRESYRKPLYTWHTNVMGSLNLLEALKSLQHPCSVVMVTTDKVYENREWEHGYRETDRLGGHDPYSASKAAAELAVQSWRDSFCGQAPYQTPYLRIATARAGNVIGGGDWAADRIVPDAMRALAAQQTVSVRNPNATRPWQHVLEAISGYLLLAQQLLTAPAPPCEAFNFGPHLSSNRPVRDLIEAMLRQWDGEWALDQQTQAPHEAGVLHLQIDKAHHQLGWEPRWDFNTTVERTVGWYRDVAEGEDPLARSLEDLVAYQVALQT
jgi:CDP-glucose 4,6-dehydratase